MLGGKKIFYVRGAENCDVKCECRMRENCYGGLFWNLRVSEMPFPAFWGKNLQNSEGYETPYKNTQIKYLNYLG